MVSKFVIMITQCSSQTQMVNGVQEGLEIYRYSNGSASYVVMKGEHTVGLENSIIVMGKVMETILLKGGRIVGPSSQRRAAIPMVNTSTESRYWWIRKIHGGMMGHSIRSKTSDNFFICLCRNGNISHVNSTDGSQISWDLNGNNKQWQLV